MPYGKSLRTWAYLAGVGRGEVSKTALLLIIGPAQFLEGRLSEAGVASGGATKFMFREMLLEKKEQTNTDFRVEYMLSIQEFSILYNETWPTFKCNFKGAVFCADHHSHTEQVCALSGCF